MGYPIPDFIWLQDEVQIDLTNYSLRGQIINTLEDVVITSEYSIPSASLNDSANYTCSAMNFYGNDTITYTVQVYCKSVNYTMNLISTFSCVFSTHTKFNSVISVCNSNRLGMG